MQWYKPESGPSRRPSGGWRNVWVGKVFLLGHTLDGVGGTFVYLENDFNRVPGELMSV